VRCFLNPQKLKIPLDNFKKYGIIKQRERRYRVLILLRLLYRTLNFERYKFFFTKEDIERGRNVVDFRRVGKFWVEFLVIDVNEEGRVEGFEACGMFFGIFSLENLVIPFRVSEEVYLEDIERGLVTAGDLLWMGLEWLERLMEVIGYE
jgi:hypothetical protein